MSDDVELFIVIVNWRRFQRYGKRNPPWIKTYRELLSDDDYLNLTGDQRAILHGLWITYASTNAQLRLDTRSISYRLRLRVTMPQLKRLEQAGFITFAHTPRVQDVCLETETEKEKKKPRALPYLATTERPLKEIIEESLKEAAG